MFREYPRAAAAAAVLWLMGAFFGVSFIRSAAATYDEPVHLASGYSYWLPGRYRLNVSDHPPLAEMWAALPLLAMRPGFNRAHPDWIRMRRYPFADAFLYQNRIPPGMMLNAARLFSFLTLFAALGAMLFAWGMRLGGPGAAVGAVGAAALTPVLFSNLAGDAQKDLMTPPFADSRDERFYGPRLISGRGEIGDEFKGGHRLSSIQKPLFC